VFTRIAGYALAGLVHLMAPALLATAAYLLTRPTFFTVPAALIALDLAWLLRPRPGRFPSPAQSLDRTAAPRLFALLDRIGAEAGAPRVDMVAITGEVNASYGTYGWRRRRLIEIGYPLWVLLTPQERVSLLAHELAHAGNGDDRRGLVVGGALHSLMEVRRVTTFAWRPGDGISRLFTHGFLALAGLPVRALLLLLGLLFHRSSQRAEHRADEMQARIAGPVATASLLDVLITRGDSVSAFLNSSAVAVGTDPLWTALRTQLGALPESELERHRGTARLEKRTVDSTHPPTYLRLQRIAALPDTEPRVRADEMETIDAELERAASRVAQALRENAQSARYR
jgi:Zn-dependent protease with chaperone function